MVGRKYSKVVKIVEEQATTHNMDIQNYAVTKQENPDKHLSKNSPVKVSLLHGRKVTTMSTKLYRELTILQKTSNNLMSKNAFNNIVQEIFDRFGTISIEDSAVTCLQEACEMYLTQLFRDAYDCTLHSNRMTLLPEDIKCAQKVRGP